MWDACSGKNVHLATEWTQPNKEAVELKGQGLLRCV